MEQKIVMYGSPEAAVYRSDIAGWLSNGDVRRFWGKDEHMARWSGCTHLKCECGNIYEKGRTRCKSCQAKVDMEKFHSLPIEKWDGTTPCCIFDTDTYFFGDDIIDYVADADPNEELRICKCKPGYLGLISDDNWCDDLPEDGELPEDVQNAVEALNAAIRAAGPVCWWEDAVAIDVTDLRSRIATPKEADSE